MPWQVVRERDNTCGIGEGPREHLRMPTLCPSFAIIDKGSSHPQKCLMQFKIKISS